MKIHKFKDYFTINESISEKLYHGNRKGDFPPEKRRFHDCIFLTSNINFAKDFAGFDDRDEFPNGSVWEVKLKNGLNLCNLMYNKDLIKLNIKDVLQKMIDDNYIDKENRTKFSKVSIGLMGYDIDGDKEFKLSSPEESVYHYIWRIKNGAWRVIETEPIIEKIKLNGYDGFLITERGSKNVAIFNEDSIEFFKKVI
jgi:predicted secreted protein